MQNTDKEKPVKFKVVLLGEGSVGKSSIILRYIEDKFNANHESTMQASFSTKKLNIDGKNVLLSIWDTAGQEKFHALSPIYYRMSNGAILVYDITDWDSFIKVKCWVTELRMALGSDVCLIIAGNKTDLETERKVPLQEVEEYAKQVNAESISVSAKVGIGVSDMFLGLAASMLKKHLEKKAKEQLANRSNSLQRKVLVVSDESLDTLEDSNHRSRFKCCTG